MLKWLCPFCGATLSEQEAELGVGRECPSCSKVSDCPQEEYHKQRLHRLAEVKQTRALTPAELREAAIHYKALGRDERAQKALQKAELLAQGEHPEHEIEVEAASRELPVGVVPEPPAPAKVVEPHKYAAWPDPVNRPVGSEIGPLTAGAVLFVILLLFGMVVDPERLVRLTMVNGLAALLIAAGCGVRGGNCGVALFLSLFLPPGGVIYACLTTTWERVTVTDAARLVGAVLLAVGCIPWLIIAVIAMQNDWVNQTLVALGLA